MHNSFCCSLSLALALVLLPAQSAKADTVFDVSGSAQNVSGFGLGSCGAGANCPFSGTLTVNVTAGTADAVDITFPGLATFDVVGLSTPISVPPSWRINADNSTADALSLEFATTPTAASLMGFEGGTIIGDVVLAIVGDKFLYTHLSGTITPQVTPVPEPSSLGMLAGGLLAFAGIIRLRKRKPVV